MFFTYCKEHTVNIPCYHTITKPQNKLLVPGRLRQCQHSLLNVVIVRFELPFEVHSLLVQASECDLHIFELTLSLQSAPMLGSNVHGDGIEEVLKGILLTKSADLGEVANVLEGAAFQFWVAE